MTPAKANQELLNLIMVHLQQLQSGVFGEPTLEDLDFCGKLHHLIETNKT